VDTLQIIKVIAKAGAGLIVFVAAVSAAFGYIWAKQNEYAIDDNVRG
jgi:hypothetical protein